VGLAVDLQATRQFFSRHAASDCANGGVGISDIRQIENKATEIIPASLQINSSDPHFGAMRSFKFISSEPELFLSGEVQANSSCPHTDCGECQYERKKSNRITRGSLPKGFAFLCTVAGLCGGLVTGFFLLRAGRE